MQAFDGFFAHFGLQKLVPIVAIALVCASVGGMLTWLAGPSKGLLLIARREGYLPPFFQQQNANEIPVNILVVQGGITTVIALLYALVPSVSSAATARRHSGSSASSGSSRRRSSRAAARPPTAR
jgi:amino acid transporter